MNRPAAPVIVSYNIIAGNAGYDSSWGVAITMQPGDGISWARVIKGRGNRMLIHNFSIRFLSVC